MTRGLWILLMLVTSTGSFAAHIAGGELQYKYLGAGSSPNSDRYQVTMRLFRECSSTGPQLATEIVNVGAYNTSNYSLAASVVLPLVSNINVISYTPSSIPCLMGAPEVCYQVAIYSAQIELPRSSVGYTLAWSRCCRANGIINIGGGQIGATYIAKIPGTVVLGNEVNSSPEFVVKDTALVCGKNSFVLDFGATDADGDSLTYAFCDAYLGGSTNNQNAPPPSTLILQSLPYVSPFSGYEPLGSTVHIDRKTGIISGIAPATTGRFVVNVCVTEWRRGVAISEHRKDFILKVGDCDIISAELPPEIVMCKNFTRVFENESNSTQIQSYYWDFGVTSSANDTSVTPNPTFTFPDTGVYKVMLIINRHKECTDTAVSTVRVFPGFFPNFTVNGSCYQNPFNFTDATTATYGAVNKWNWDFGNTESDADTSHLRNPGYRYPNAGQRTAMLTVGSNKGCIDTITRPVNVLEKPFLDLPFHDTLICNVDTLPLRANGSGLFSWYPTTNMINSNSSGPLVYPKDTITYVVELNENGCRTKDSIKVNVLDHINVQLQSDTAICATDSIKLTSTSYALAYSWYPVNGLSSATAKSPNAAPSTKTKYIVTANLGKCQAKDSIEIRVSPYPIANAGRDTTICFGDKLQLNGNVQCIQFTWYPSNSIINGNTLSPTAGPSTTTNYVLKATGYNECPKSVYDTINIKVIPPVKAFAGRDTVVTVDQPLVLHASGGVNYSWSPAFYISNANSSSPRIILGDEIDSMIYKVRAYTPEGCYGDDEIKIIVFKTGADMFIPDAFSPNKDGRNDLFKPILVGIQQLDFFKVYDRFGHPIFATSDPSKGWDGTIGGKEQPPGTYIYVAQAVNYKGQTLSKKGTVLLIR